jgi:beta-lactamase superfamily II metal-dependent hydrolase
MSERPNIRGTAIPDSANHPRLYSLQVDMFDVQLGTALLSQFRNDDGEVVRILADAGVDPRSGYRQNHILGPLKQAMQDFDDSTLRLDLVIGTHYDSDHLDGLIPVFEDISIETTEAWLPPVANDTEPHALEDQPQERQLLAKQFDSENSRDVLRRYFEPKRQACEKLQAMQRTAENIHAAAEREYPVRDMQRRYELHRRDDWFERELEEFKRHLDEAGVTLGERPDTRTHADDDIQTPPEDFPQHASVYKGLRANRVPGWDWLWAADERKLLDYWSQRPDRAAVDARGLALIRKSTARDAINAASLSKVVTALRSRKIPISCRIIEDGIPRRFVWRRDEHRFVEGMQLVGAPELKLLGPSRSLVKKHWDRLPIGDYMRMMFAVLLPSKRITPSNQLSYVARLGFKRQGILISGDAGCVDFAPGRGSKFFKALLDALLPLHVVQVAHHGGNNAKFYNVLLSAQYASQPSTSALLLSHATNDPDRPSDLFGQFVAAVRKDADNVRIYFTGRPRDAFVKDYQALIAPTVGTPKPAGDIRLAYDGRRWLIEKHAVQVP